jgi:hypothetical protein
VIEVLPILGQAPAPVQPGERPLHQPTFRQHDEALHRIRTFDDLHLHLCEHGSHRGAELGPLITAIGVKLQEKGIETEQRSQQPRAAVAILDVCCTHDGVQHQTLGIDQKAPLLAFDLLACVIPGLVDAGTTLFRAFDALGVDDRRRGTGLP